MKPVRSKRAKIGDGGATAHAQYEMDSRRYSYHMRLRRTIAANVKRLREERNMDVDQVARACSMSGANVRKIETGMYMPRETVLIRFADYFGVRLADLQMPYRRALL